LFRHVKHDGMLVNMSTSTLNEGYQTSYWQLWYYNHSIAYV